MSGLKIIDFFNNKVSIRLKDGNQFKGLLSQINYKNNSDLGNAYDKEQIPLDKKINEKQFQADQLQEIVITNHVFAEPKKYNPDDFFDSMTEKKQERGQRNRGHGGYRGNRGSNHRGGNRGGQRDYREHGHGGKKYEEKKRKYEKKDQSDDQRQYR